MGDFYTRHLFFCINQKPNGKKCCSDSAAPELFVYMKKKLQLMGLFGEGKNRVSSSSCMGRCSDGPCLVVYPDAIWYRCETEEDVDRIIDLHLIQNQPVKELLIDTK